MRCIALATVHKLDKIISCNFTHIVCEKTRAFTKHINAINGYRSIDINSPDELIEHETT
jgi:hypothetical protein